ncbi:MAG: prepilin-type N-terminal cleavage/methylation domain-containing protein [Candidatus Omnitrophica bacterium]|nr:prepilin-type N-terminal cleavage/methylation domain-containing protein [Candidatus Omnitrophota bacterium]
MEKSHLLENLIVNNRDESLSNSIRYKKNILKLRTSRAGFTLLEALIVAVIFSFIIAGIYGVMNVANVSYPTDLGMLDLQQQARQTMQWITRETREASLVTITTGTDSDSISFNTPNESGIQYSVVNNQVIRSFSGTRTIAFNIASLRFSQSGNLLQIQVNAASTVLLKPLAFSLTEKVRLRNE